MTVGVAPAKQATMGGGVVPDEAVAEQEAAVSVGATVVWAVTGLAVWRMVEGWRQAPGCIALLSW